MIAPTMLFCIAVGKMAYKTELWKRQGMAQETAWILNQAHFDPKMRQWGRKVVWFIYQANDDNRMSAKFMQEEVKYSCLNPE